MKKLIKGILEFRQNVREDYKETFARLALTQTPDVFFIGCSDSRVVPNLFASTNPGDLFVLRNVGNLVPPYEAHNVDHGNQSVVAALEFALLKLNVPQIIVCGHSACGAMNALTVQEKLDVLPHLRAWLKAANITPETFKDKIEFESSLSHTNQLSQINVLLQIEHLKTYPLVQERLREGMLSIHGWWFDIADAAVYAFEEEFKKFILIDETEAERILRKLEF
jgi:carbonic anhydrase